jgi:hypothetical protein
MVGFALAVFVGFWTVVLKVVGPEHVSNDVIAGVQLALVAAPAAAGMAVYTVAVGLRCLANGRSVLWPAALPVAISLTAALSAAIPGAWDGNLAVSIPLTLFWGGPWLPAVIPSADRSEPAYPVGSSAPRSVD